MCGRYALGIRASYVRYQIQQQGLPVDNAPEDDDVRQTYNFAPGSTGLVYRAEIPDQGGRSTEETQEEHEGGNDVPKTKESTDVSLQTQTSDVTSYKHRLQAMRWGLIPFWTKRSPDYSSMLRTINCRDDSLLENRGMWNSMKQRKRCIVICQGFYEWLKKGPGGKDKTPYFVKRKDGELMCFAGLWDVVKYEDAEDKLYSYTIITTQSNQQLRFLHDRMPVILDAGSEEMKSWLDPGRDKWSKELQSFLQPYQGELECYPVSKEVGKVSNNSPSFIVPIDSKENKKNIARFFGSPKEPSEKQVGKATTNDNEIVKDDHDQPEQNDDRLTQDQRDTEHNAPVPIPHGTKREHSAEEDTPLKTVKIEDSSTAGEGREANSTPSRKTRSATSNAASNAAFRKHESPKTVDDSHRITSFFGK